MSALAVGGAIVGGGLGLFQARARNRAIQRRQRAIAEAAEISLERVGDFLTQTRVRSILDTSNLSRNLQRTVGAATARLPSGRGADEIVAMNLVGSASQDTSVLKLEQDAREKAIEAERENIVTASRSSINQLGSQTSSPVLATFTGALQGLQAGLAIDTGFSQLAQLKNAASFSKAMGPLNQQIANFKLTEVKAAGEFQQSMFDIAQSQLQFLNSVNSLLEGSIPR